MTAPHLNTPPRLGNGLIVHKANYEHIALCCAAIRRRREHEDGFRVLTWFRQRDQKGRFVRRAGA